MSDQLPMPVTAPFTRAQKATLLNLVSRAAETEIMPRFRTLDTGEIAIKSSASDLVTQADKAAEAMIARGLQRAFPHAVVIGEEAAEQDKTFREKLAEAELGFIIDPVDGTWNFARGLPAFGTMVAATRFGQPVFGMIYDPVGKDVMWADIDTPAAWVPRTKRTKKLQTAETKPISELMGYIELTFMQDDHKKAAALKALELGHFGTLRCSAHQYRLLASGAVDFYLAAKLAPWDHAAGVHLTHGAGGYSAFLDGRLYDTSIDSGYLLSASSKDTWLQLRDHFAELLQ